MDKQFSEVMNESGCVCANVYCKVSETKKKKKKRAVVNSCID